jgi:three-Cys-motif partner protein
MIRAWGPWSRFKLQVLDDYLRAFAVASTRSIHRVYLDAFAGEGEGIDRMTGERFAGSARIALEVNPPFTHLRYFELDRQRAARLERDLRAAYPGRDIRVYPDDCNVAIRQALADLQPVRQAAAFAFLDPDGQQLHFDTIRAIAEHKAGLPRKVEQWILFMSSGLMRNLVLREEDLTEAQADKATAMFGMEAWRATYERRCAGRINPAVARKEYVNLLRWQLEKELGYATTLGLEVKTTTGQLLYHMIFATDHPTGERIMLSEYTKAVGQAPELRDVARRGDDVQLRLDLGPGTYQPDRMFIGEVPPPPRIA